MPVPSSRDWVKVSNSAMSTGSATLLDAFSSTTSMRCTWERSIEAMPCTTTS